MNKLVNLVKKLRIPQILTIFLAGVLLFVSTACSGGDVTGARPNNPPVQAGGNNNPHSGSGDGYTNYKATTDPNINSKKSASDRNHADSQLISNQIIATSSNSDNNPSGLIYPGSDSERTINNIGPRGAAELSRDAVEVPAKRQAVLDRNDPNAKILERTSEAFKEASSFLKDTADEAGARPELQINPGAHRK